MGDRALVVFTDDGETYSPAVYVHNAGEEIPSYIKKAAPLMRAGDSSYALARFAGYVASQVPGPLGMGIIAGPTPGADGKVDWEDYSHGDRGVYVVNVHTGEVVNHDGDTKSFKIDPKKFAQA